MAGPARKGARGAAIPGHKCPYDYVRLFACTVLPMGWVGVATWGMILNNGAHHQLVCTGMPCKGRPAPCLQRLHPTSRANCCRQHHPDLDFEVSFVQLPVQAVIQEPPSDREARGKRRNAQHNAHKVHDSASWTQLHQPGDLLWRIEGREEATRCRGGAGGRARPRSVPDYEAWLQERCCCCCCLPQGRCGRRRSVCFAVCFY